jgi:hypothetical protein
VLVARKTEDGEEGMGLSEGRGSLASAALIL